jgi:hypothetical protein
MDRAVMSRWGVSPSEFTAAVAEHPTEDQILSWLSERVTSDRVNAANEWLLHQTSSLDRQDAEEGVPGAFAPLLPRKVIVGLVVAAITLLAAWLAKALHS